MKTDLQRQSNAAHGFRLWLTSLLARQTEASREFSHDLLCTLEIYESECNRRIDGVPATQDLFAAVVSARTLARMLLNELLDWNPDLNASCEPQTIPEMAFRLLRDAVELFEASEQEMSTYLEQPVFPARVTELISAAQTVQSLA